MVQLEFLGLNFTCVFDSLEHYEIPPTHECLIPLISKLMGYAIIVGASVVKVPQIILIMKNRSIEGLSVTSFELEVVAFTISLAYCVWKNLPFSAYGELFFLLLQGIVLVVLLYYFSPRLGPLTWLKAAVYCAFTPQLLAGKVNETLFESLYAGQHAILIFARLPQIYENYTAKSTGQLSFLSNFVSFGGGVARLLTLVQAKAPGNMLLGTTLGLLLNGTIVFQIVYYRSGTKKAQKLKIS